MELNNLKKSLELLGAEFIAELTKELLKSDKRATGNLINSLSYEVLSTIDSLLLQIKTADYFQFVDKGRRPGKRPPIKAIIPWIRAKGIKTRGKTDEQIAFAISNSIGKKGIKPLNVKDKVINNILNNKKELIQKGLIDDIENLLDKLRVN